MDDHPEAGACITTMQGSRERMDSLLAHIRTAEVLCEIARDLRQYNAELREILLETRLEVHAKYEQCLKHLGKQTT